MLKRIFSSSKESINHKSCKYLRHTFFSNFKTRKDQSPSLVESVSIIIIIIIIIFFSFLHDMKFLKFTFSKTKLQIYVSAGWHNQHILTYFKLTFKMTEVGKPITIGLYSPIYTFSGAVNSFANGDVIRFKMNNTVSNIFQRRCPAKTPSDFLPSILEVLTDKGDVKGISLIFSGPLTVSPYVEVSNCLLFSWQRVLGETLF